MLKWINGDTHRRYGHPPQHQQGVSRFSLNVKDTYQDERPLESSSFYANVDWDINEQWKLRWAVDSPPTRRKSTRLPMSPSRNRLPRSWVFRVWSRHRWCFHHSGRNFSESAVVSVLHSPHGRAREHHRSRQHAHRDGLPRKQGWTVNRDTHHRDKHPL